MGGSGALRLPDASENGLELRDSFRGIERGREPRNQSPDARQVNDVESGARHTPTDHRDAADDHRRSVQIVERGTPPRGALRPIAEGLPDSYLVSPTRRILLRW